MRRSVNSKRRNTQILAGACVAGGVALALSPLSRAALLSNVVFNDTLATNGGTINNGSTAVTATSTNYSVASSKNATATIFNSGSPLQLEMVSTSGGVNQVQALFTTTPVVLTNVGDAIELTVTFTDVAGLNINSSSSMDIGMYNSGGVAPYNFLYNGGSSSGSLSGVGDSYQPAGTYSTGGVQNWLGYESDAFGGSKPKLYTRPAQTATGSGTNNVAQTLIADGQTGGVEYPAGSQPSSYTTQSSASDPMTAGSTYTDELEIMVAGGGNYTLTDMMYAGNSDNAAPVNSGVSGNLAVSAGSFDGLAIGLRESDSVQSEMDISQVEVTTTVSTAIPEPASLGILGLAGLGLLRRRQRKT